MRFSDGFTVFFLTWHNQVSMQRRKFRTTRFLLYSFHLPPGGGGYPSPRFFPRSLVPGPFWGTPYLARECPSLSQVVWLGYPIAGTGVPPPQLGLNSRASTCHLAFMQEDFLVSSIVSFSFPLIIYCFYHLVVRFSFLSNQNFWENVKNNSNLKKDEMITTVIRVLCIKRFSFLVWRNSVL